MKILRFNNIGIQSLFIGGRNLKRFPIFLSNEISSLVEAAENNSKFAIYSSITIILKHLSFEKYFYAAPVIV